MKRASQEAKIMRHLNSGKTLTGLQALKKFGCFRLAARIERIKSKFKFPVVTVMVGTPGGARVAQYRKG